MTTSNPSEQPGARPAVEAFETTTRVRTYLDVSHRVGDLLLATLHDVCVQHGIQYFLTSGTLLGCLRHQGWIDWDDDIDVVMFREDFDRFRLVAHGALPDHVLFSDGTTNPEHITSIPRLLYLPSQRRPSGRTRARRPIETRHVALDIFVLDLAPATRRSRRVWMRVAYLLERVAVARMTSARDVLAETDLPVARTLAELAAVMFSRALSKRGWHRLRDRWITYRSGHSRPGPYMAANYSTPHGRTCTFQRDWYFPASTATFSRQERWIPHDPAAVLTELFGPSFMTPPPVHDRQPIHIRNGLHVEMDGQSWDIPAE